MTKDSGDFRDIFSNLYSNSTGNRFVATTVIALIIVFSYTGYDTLVYRHEVIQNYTEDNQWLVSFDTTNETIQQVEVLQDEEVRNIELNMSDISIPDGFRIGYVEILINGEEMAGLASGNQCDSIAGDIIRNDLTAQWDNSNNKLSGQDSSCVPIDLNLQIYPDYDGLDRTVNSINEYQAIMNWTKDAWGKGSLSLDLELDTNSPGPFQIDSDEEITIDITVVMFKASVQAAE